VTHCPNSDIKQKPAPNLTRSDHRSLRCDGDQVPFHFLFEGASGWEAVGSGEGAGGGDPGFQQAFADLDALTGGLQPGA
jgi:hypothetical protein